MQKEKETPCSEWLQSIDSFAKYQQNEIESSNDRAFLCLAVEKTPNGECPMISALHGTCGDLKDMLLATAATDESFEAILLVVGQVIARHNLKELLNKEKEK